MYALVKIYQTISREFLGGSLLNNYCRIIQQSNAGNSRGVICFFHVSLSKRVNVIFVDIKPMKKHPGFEQERKRERKKEEFYYFIYLFHDTSVTNTPTLLYTRTVRPLVV